MNKNVDYERNVFINCPFDSGYSDIFNAILFTTYSCGFVLRCSKEYEDSSSIRIKIIVGLINDSKYSIHDLSRITLDETSQLPRFNMPLELGICIGAIEFGKKIQKDNKYLIIESDKFRFQKFISDISGQDIKSHNNNKDDAIKIIRNWLSTKTNRKIKGGSSIVENYNKFLLDLPELCKENKWKPTELTYSEHAELVKAWLLINNIS